MKKIQQLFDSLNQKLEGDLSKATLPPEQPTTNPEPTEYDAQAHRTSKLDTMFELPLSPMANAAAKGLGSLKSMISPVTSKIGAKVADVLHHASTKSDEELLLQTRDPRIEPQLDPLLMPRKTTTFERQTQHQPVHSKIAGIDETASPLIRTTGYQSTKQSEYDLAEDTLADEYGSPAVEALPLQQNEPTGHELPATTSVRSAPLPQQTPREVVQHSVGMPTEADNTPHVVATSAAPILSAELVKTPTKPLPPPRKAKRDLPVLDMSHIQRNLERSQRKLAIEGAKMPERKIAEPLPVIDPNEVRERLQDIHNGKRPSPKIVPQHAQRTPLQPQSSTRLGAVITPKISPTPMQRPPEPEVIRVFQATNPIPDGPIAPAMVPPLAAAVAAPVTSVLTDADRLVDDSYYSDSMAPEFSAAVVASDPPVASLASPSAAKSHHLEMASSDALSGYALETNVNHSLPPNTVVSAAPQRPQQFMRPDAIVPAARPMPNLAWRGEDGLCLPLELLRPATAQTITVTQEDLLERSILIEEKLNEFKVKVSVLDAYAGPVITRFEVEPATGIRGAQVVNLAKDLARSLGLASVRVVETIPGKTCMGLELPNPTRQMIRLSEILSAPEYHQQVSPLTIALGKDISGIPVATDLAKTPHMLVAGTTGSGKSVGVNAMILSILFKATPDEVRFIMIDPKMLELSVYEGIPHLLAPVVTDMKLAANALNWCVGEMEKRYRLMSAMGVRNLAGFNQKVAEAEAVGRKLTNPFTLTPDDPEPLEHLPMIVVVVDEFADLMMVAGKKIEELIARLAQKARAAGIHLILATQRPSVDVITGLIKANIPTRLAFQVSSKIDSRTILDQMGAEALLGQGDMLFLPPGTGYPQRIHGAFVDDAEVHCVVEYLKQLGEPNYIEGVLYPATEAEAGGSWSGIPGDAEESDPLYDEAVAHVLRSRRASISAVQRQFRIGYNRAARLIEQMEAAGIVSGMESNGNRTVLAPSNE